MLIDAGIPGKYAKDYGGEFLDFWNIEIGNRQRSMFNFFLLISIFKLNQQYYF